MKDDHRDDLVMEFIAGRASPSRKAELEKMLAGEGYDIAELDELAAMYADLGEIEIPSPGAGMSARFYDMLESEKKAAALAEDEAARGPSPGTGSSGGWLGRLFGMSGALVPRFAYAFLFLVAGWALAYWMPPGGRYDEKISYMSSEMDQMKKMMMFSMLNRSSASERLQAVQYLKGAVDGDDQVLTAMLDTFERDPNVNVRLATLDALSLVPRNDRVKDSVLRNIASQDSPIIQLALVEMAVSMKYDGAASALKALLEKPGLNFTVRMKATEGLRFLS